MKTAYYNDKIVVRRKRYITFLGVYKTTYKDNFIKVKLLGESYESGTSVGRGNYTFLIELPDKSRRKVYEGDLFTKRECD